jgi:hypothetical protein
VADLSDMPWDAPLTEGEPTEAGKQLKLVTMAANLNAELVREQQQEIIRLSHEILRLRRGEFICRSCGLRKDSEPEVAHEF